MNARLGDFGLSRLADHNTNPHTTHIVGTIGYIAPEASRMQKPPIFTDIYAFGMFLLEVSCGRRPIDEQAASGDFFLVDGVYCCWKRGPILEAGDPQLKRSYDNEEMELILKLGLLCVHPKAEERPSMRQVVSFLDRDAIIPDIPSDFDPEIKGFLMEGSGTSSYMLPLSSGSVSLGPYPNVNSILQFGL